MNKKLFVYCTIIRCSFLFGMDQQPKPATYPSSQLSQEVKFELVEKPKVRRPLPSLLIVDVTGKPPLSNTNKKPSSVPRIISGQGNQNDPTYQQRMTRLFSFSPQKGSKPRSQSESAIPSSSNQSDVLLLKPNMSQYFEALLFDVDEEPVSKSYDEEDGLDLDSVMY